MKRLTMAVTGAFILGQALTGMTCDRAPAIYRSPAAYRVVTPPMALSYEAPPAAVPRNAPVDTVRVLKLHSGSPYTASVRFAGAEEGEVHLSVQGVNLGCRIVEWTPRCVRFQIPELHVPQEVRGTLQVFRADGKELLNVPVLLDQNQLQRDTDRPVSPSKISRSVRPPVEEEPRREALIVPSQG